MRFLPAALVLLAGTAAAVAAETRHFHVSPTGSDQGPGTRESPFASPGRALEAVRAARAADEAAHVTLHDGVYTLREPLVLTPGHSGTADRPVVIEAAPGARPVLSGGRRLTGWKETRLGDKTLWAAPVPGGGAHRQLWVGRQRRPRARHPSKGFLKVAGLPDADAKTPWNQGQSRLRYHKGDIPPLENPQEARLVVLHLWVSVRLAVEGIDPEGQTVTFLRKSRRRLTDGSEPARYYLENAPELLDAPGEWYLDRKSGTLYYHPLPGEKPGELDAVVADLPELLRFAGEPEKGRHVEHVVLRGLSLAHAEWWPARDDTADVQAAASVPAVVHGVGMRHCLLEDLKLGHASGYGIHLERGCHHNTVARCELSDLGAGGIRVGEMRSRTREDEQTHHNTIRDCHLHALGRIFHQGVGVWVGQSFGNRVEHNHIHDLYYTGISCGWTWGYGPTLARENLIVRNHVHDVGQGLLSDMGGIYTLGVQPGTVIRGNVFHDIGAYRYGGWGIYLDEGSSHIVAEGNLVYRTSHGGFHQHYGKENLVRSNVLALGRDAQVRRTRLEEHTSFTFERNIVYWKTGTLLDGRWDELRAGFDHNLYWKEGGGDIRLARWSWDEWREKGMDTHSLIADPGFTDPARGDFRLREGSPALKLGIRPPSAEGVGPRPREKDK